MTLGKPLRLRLGALALAAIAAGPGCGGGSGSPTGPMPSPTPATRALAYTALGASDAVGIGAFPPTRGYVYLLRDRMEGVRTPVTLDNLGISGATADEIARDALAQAIASDPDVVTVWTGPNDVIAGRDPDVFAAQLDGLLAELRARTDAQVFVGDLPDLTRAPLFAIDPDDDVTRQRIDAFNRRIETVVAARGCVLVRLSTLSLDLDTFSIDGFHPSNTGHERIADLYWAEIRPRI
jgi:lysophospholipase L1-like esterase